MLERAGLDVQQGSRLAISTKRITRRHLAWRLLHRL